MHEWRCRNVVWRHSYSIYVFLIYWFISVAPRQAAATYRYPYHCSVQGLGTDHNLCILTCPYKKILYNLYLVPTVLVQEVVNHTMECKCVEVGVVDPSARNQFVSLQSVFLYCNQSLYLTLTIVHFPIIIANLKFVMLIWLDYEQDLSLQIVWFITDIKFCFLVWLKKIHSYKEDIQSLLVFVDHILDAHSSGSLY